MACKKFTALLRDLLEVKGINQKWLTDKAVTTESTISRYLKGGNRLEIAMVVRIAKALDESVDYLCGLTNLPSPKETLGTEYHMLLRCYGGGGRTGQKNCIVDFAFQVDCMDGPTSKAQNINHVITKIKDFELSHKWRFSSLTIHDSEDVVHPYELKVTNYLLEKHDAMQFPVFPLMQMPRFKNFFKP